MYSLYDLFPVMLLVLLLVYWWRSREQHGFALKSAREYCRHRGIQLLDETLVFDKYTISRPPRGGRRLSRVYTFEFCRDGQDRHQGELTIAGYRVLHVMLQSDGLEITHY